MEIKDLILLMWRKALYIVLGLFLGLSLGFWVVKVETPVYEASSKFYVSRIRQQSNTDALSLSDEQLLAINLQIAKSQPVLDNVSSQLGRQIDADNIRVDAIPNTLIIQVKVQDTDPERAAEIANLLVQTLVQQNAALLSARYSALEDSIAIQVDEIQNQIEDLQNQITQLSETGLQEQLVQVNQQIEELKTQISTLEMDIASFPSYTTPLQRATIAEKQAQLDQLNNLMMYYQQIQTNLTYIGKPTQGESSLENPHLAILQSTLEMYQQMKLTLISNLENIRLAREQNSQNVMQIVFATPPKDPVRPMPVVYVLLSSVLGLALAVTFILMIDQMDVSLKSARQTGDLLGVPVLGSVFESKRIKNKLVAAQAPFSDEAEAFRTLGASIEILSTEKNVRTLMIVNAEPSDAKTAIAANLALINAQQGKRVILLDGDRKKPYLHNLFGVENNKGFADLLRNIKSINSASQDVDDVKGMTLIPSGVSEKDSTVWLDAEKLSKVFSIMQEQADLVIVDGPSAEDADTQVLASKMDAVLLVIKLGHTRIGSAQSTLRRFQLINTEVLGTVLKSNKQYRNINKQVLTQIEQKLYGKGKSGEVESKIGESPISLP